VNNTIKWLLEGDVSVQYMVHRWLLDADEHMLKQLQSRIALEGFGKGRWALGLLLLPAQMDLHALYPA
jgi:hypothetical protein